MKQLPLMKVATWVAFAFCATPFAFAQDVKIDSAPRRMVLISGGEFLMGAATNGNPTGPDFSFDPAEPNEKKRVYRGGSFLCNEPFCSRYMVGTRDKGEVNTGTNHLGFRCVKDRGAKTAGR
jgi:formylglycine-generating enzyme required for sulfatase activity